MQSVSCGTDESSGQTLAGTVLGTGGAHSKTREMLCPEYVLTSDKVSYRIRPTDEKHPDLLPIGENAQFRVKKDRLYLRVTEMDDKERQYRVVSMTPLAGASTHQPPAASSKPDSRALPSASSE
jgi:hypothetical protein